MFDLSILFFSWVYLSEFIKSKDEKESIFLVYQLQAFVYGLEFPLQVHSFI